MKLFVAAFLLIILGAVAIGGIYFYGGFKPKTPELALNQPVTQAPVSLNLDINSPDDDSLSFDSNILVSGKTIPNSQILISTKSQDLVVESKSDGNFSTLINLDEGVNNFQITAFDKNGEGKTLERTVYFSKEKLQ